MPLYVVAKNQAYQVHCRFKMYWNNKNGRNESWDNKNVLHFTQTLISWFDLFFAVHILDTYKSPRVVS